MLGFITTIYAGNEKEQALKGRVIDSYGEPVAGAKVIVDDKKAAVYTDFQGRFSIPAAPKKTHRVKISMVSYQDKVTTIDLKDSNNNLSITLKSK